MAEAKSSGPQQRIYKDMNGIEHVMVNSKQFTVQQSPSGEINGLYNEMEGVLEENYGKPRFKHESREFYIWWSGNWHISIVASEEECEKAGGDEHCMYYYWVCDHLETQGGKGGPEAAPHYPMQTGWMDNKDNYVELTLKSE